eukprot:11136748-Alexandrium_andersonii.AAC.1
MSASLVGSEMCIRDRSVPACASLPESKGLLRASRPDHGSPCEGRRPRGCLLYTSDAADDM